MKRRKIPSNRTNFNIRNPVSNRVARILAAHYANLKRDLGIEDSGNYMSMSYEDIFHNAILCTIQDIRAAHFRTEAQVLKYFEYRYHCIVMQIIKDSQLIHYINYADNQQTPPNPEE